MQNSLVVFRVFSIFSVLALFLCKVICGCGATRQSVPIDFKVQIKDAIFRKFADVTDQIMLKASGSLVAGTYIVNSVPVTVPVGTKFTIDVTVPVRGSDQINCGQAVGSIGTSQALTIMGVPAPLMVQLQNGSASADVNLGRTLVTLVLNALQSVLPESLSQNRSAPEHPESGPDQQVVSNANRRFIR